MAFATYSIAAPAQQFDAATAFGARESIEQASLSPDGTRLAYVAPTTGQGGAVFVVSLDQAGAVPKRIASAPGTPERISGCRWASNSRLLCTLYAIQRIDGAIAYATRIVAMDADGGRAMVLRQARGRDAQSGFSLFGGSVIDWNPGVDGEVLMMREYQADEISGTRLLQAKSGIGVDAVNIVTLKTRVIERPNDNASEFYTDGRGIVRISGRSEYRDGYSTGVRRYYFRRKGSREWEALSTVSPGERGFDPYGVDPDLDIAYGLKPHEGRLAVFKKALDGSGMETLVFAHPEVDVTGFARIGRNGRIIGASYVTDVRSVQYFDPTIGGMLRTLAKALPQLPLIHVVDSSEDENRMLVWAGSDTDPGRYFLFDRKAGSLSELMLARPELEGVTLAPMRHVTYRAADGAMVPAYLTLPAGDGKNLAAIVLPHGGPGARDEWGFDWLSQFFASRGFAVLQPNFRGSAGYGDAWFQKNGFQGWRIAIDDVLDAGRWLVKEGIADPEKLTIFGWSYGGYAALQSAAVDPQLFKKVVAVAPVTDLDRLKQESAIFTSAREVERFIGSGAHIEQGSPARQAARIKVPVLMFHGDLDRNVGVGHAELMLSRLKAAGVPGELVVFKGLDHYLDDSTARAEMLRKTELFLKAP